MNGFWITLPLTQTKEAPAVKSHSIRFYTTLT